MGIRWKKTTIPWKTGRRYPRPVPVLVLCADIFVSALTTSSIHKLPDMIKSKLIRAKACPYSISGAQWCHHGYFIAINRYRRQGQTSRARMHDSGCDKPPTFVIFLSLWRRAHALLLPAFLGKSNPQGLCLWRDPNSLDCKEAEVGLTSDCYKREKQKGLTAREFMEESIINPKLAS